MDNKKTAIVTVKPNKQTNRLLFPRSILLLTVELTQNVSSQITEEFLMLFVLTYVQLISEQFPFD